MIVSMVSQTLSPNIKSAISYLGDDVANVEKRDASRPLDIAHTQIFLHTSQASVRDINTIEVVHE
jgi:hypothetical protein